MRHYLGEWWRSSLTFICVTTPKRFESGHVYRALPNQCSPSLLEPYINFAVPQLLWCTMHTWGECMMIGILKRFSQRKKKIDIMESQWIGFNAINIYRHSSVYNHIYIYIYPCDGKVQTGSINIGWCYIVNICHYIRVEYKKTTAI